MRFPTNSLPHIERKPNALAAFPTTYSIALFVSEIRSFWRDAVTFEVGVAEMPLHWWFFLRVLRWQNLLNTDLINEVFAL